MTPGESEWEKNPIKPPVTPPMTPNRERQTATVPSTPTGRQAPSSPYKGTPQQYKAIQDAFESPDSDDDLPSPTRHAHNLATRLRTPSPASYIRGSHSQPIMTSGGRSGAAERRPLTKATTDPNLSDANYLRRLLEHKDEQLEAKDQQIMGLKRELESIKRENEFHMSTAEMSPIRPSNSTDSSTPTFRTPTVSLSTRLATSADASPTRAPTRAPRPTRDSSNGFSFGGLEDDTGPARMWN